MHVISMKRSYLNYAEDAVAAASKLHSWYQAARPYVSALRSRSVPRVRSVRAVRPTYRRHFKGRRRVARRGRKYSGRRRYTKRRSTKVAPRIPTRSVYTRRRKGIRRGNKGILNLQKRIQAGDRLPEMTFARLFYRGTGNIPFMNYSSASMSLPTNRWRVFTLNNLESSPYFGGNASDIPGQVGSHGLRGHFMYREFWQSLYKEYLVLGSTARFKIQPTVYPRNLAGASGNPQFQGLVPPHARPGYWYARVCYHRMNAFGQPGLQVGHVISEDGSFSNNLWSNERDFLSDNTVSWVRDKSSLRSKIHVHTGDALNMSGGTGQEVVIIPTAQDSTFSTSYEIELSNRQVFLRVNFSAKKNFMTKDILNDGPWRGWNQTFNWDMNYYVTIGYIGFTPNGGDVAYHTPIDRSMWRSCAADIKYFVALRGPVPNPSQYVTVEPDALAEEELVEESEDDDFEELAKEYETDN